MVLLAELEPRTIGDDWTQDPWFLRPDQQAQLRAFHFSPEDLVSARDALAIVDPSAVCRTMLGLPTTVGAPTPARLVETPPRGGTRGAQLLAEVALDAAARARGRSGAHAALGHRQAARE